MKVQKLNQRQAHWALYLSRFDFTLKYVPDTKIGKANSLSRRPDWKIGIENDNNNQKLKRVRKKDKEVAKIVKKIKKAGVRKLRGDKWEIEGDLVLKKEKVHMPKNKELRLEVI